MHFLVLSSLKSFFELFELDAFEKDTTPFIEGF